MTEKTLDRRVRIAMASAEVFSNAARSLIKDIYAELKRVDDGWREANMSLLEARNCNEASAIHAALKKAEEERRWIPVGERLPINGPDEFDTYVQIQVMVTDRVNVFETMYSAGKTPEYWGKFDAENITHWMPLPSPPEET